MSCPVCLSASVITFQTIASRAYWRCQSCLATYLDASQLPDWQTEKREYDQHNNDVTDPGYRRFLARLSQPLTEQLEKGAKGLDFGCGPGPALAQMMCESGFSMATYDPIYQPNPKVLANQYDFITCTEVVEHLHRPYQVFSQLRQLLKPGGWLGIMTQFQTEDSAFANWHYRRDPTHVVFYKAQTFEVIAAQHGWKVVTASNNVVLLKAGNTLTDE